MFLGVAGWLELNNWRAWELNSITLNESSGASRVRASCSAAFAWLIELPFMLPEVSMT